MNPKNMKKSLIHENAVANITCDFGDGDISHLGVAYLTHTIHTYIHNYLDYIKILRSHASSLFTPFSFILFRITMLHLLRCPPTSMLSFLRLLSFSPHVLTTSVSLLKFSVYVCHTGPFSYFLLSSQSSLFP